jgi:DNA-binding transcriptional MocR family regulator
VGAAPETVDCWSLPPGAEGGRDLAPGYIFRLQKFSNFIRLNAAVWSKEVERAIGRLGDLVEQEL